MALQLSLLHESGKQVINLENKRVLKLMEELPFQEVLCVCVCVVCKSIYLSVRLVCVLCVFWVYLRERERTEKDKNKFILGGIIMSTSPHVVVNALISIEVNIDRHLLFDVLTKPAYTGAAAFSTKV